jgi:hypothetical protein
MDTERTIIESYIYDLVLNAPAYISFSVEDCDNNYFCIFTHADTRKTRVAKLSKEYKELTEELINRTKR